MKKIIALCFVAVLAASVSVKAAVPQTMSYQGVLKDNAGVIVPDDDYTFEFRIYNVASGGTPLWTETQVIHTTGGLLNAILGAVNPVGLPFDVPYWLGMTIDAGTELTPRVELTGAPYALNAQSVKGGTNHIPTSGDAGFGTASPASNLHIYGDLNGTVELRLENPNGGPSSAERISFNNEDGGVAGIALFDDDSVYPQQMRIFNNRPGGEMMLGTPAANISLENTGNVGIGLTSPLEALDVDGALRIGTTPNTNAGAIRWTGADFEGYDGSTWHSFTGGGSGYLPPGTLGNTLLHNGSGWTATNMIYNDGLRVGIGTSAPAAELEVQGNGNLIDHVRLKAHTGVGSCIYFDALNEDWTLCASNPGSSTGDEKFAIRNYSKAQNAITIDSNCYIGITRDNPAAPLDLPGVNWDLDATEGDFRIGNNTYRLKFGVATAGLGAGSAGIRVQGGQERLILGAGAAEVLEIDNTGTAMIGSPTLTGDLEIYRSGISDRVLWLRSMSTGGVLSNYDELGNQNVLLGSDNSGSGAYMYLFRSETSVGVEMNGNYGGAEMPRVYFYGDYPSYFSTDLAGNSSAVLSQNAISAFERLDEPGAGSATLSSSIILDGTVQTLLSRSITAPAAGYALVIGSLEADITHTSGTVSNADFGVSDVAGVWPLNQDVDHYIHSAVPSGVFRSPISVHGLFEVTAGTNTFYLLGAETSGAYSVMDMQLTVVYLSTAYGTVSPTLGSEAGSDESPSVANSMTPGDVAAERRESEEFNRRRVQDELAELRTEVERLKREMEDDRRIKK